MYKLLRLFIGTLFLLGGSFLLSVQAQNTINPNFEKKIESLIDHSIPTVSAKVLQQKLSSNQVKLLDAREKEEFQVSHLKDAIHIGYNKPNYNALSSVSKESILVVYCSVGYRSEKIAEKLKALGYQKVYNLYGGIFEWSNLGLPIVDNQNLPTQKVHAYDKEWGKWLEKGTKIY